MNSLEDITVVAIEQAVAAPLTTRHLADLGARVIKVERPGTGDFARDYDRAVKGQSSYFVWLNRGKESIELDLKLSGDRELLDQLLADADVFVQNLGPEAADRLNLGADRLRRLNPSLIHCSISGYGAGGPFHGRKAYDLLVQCETGLIEATGTPEASAKAGISVADIASGTYAYAGILAALYERERSHLGATLEVSLLDALGEWMQQPAYYAAYGDRPTRRSGPRHASIAPYGPYRVGDAESIYLAVQNDREWLRLCLDVIADPGLATDPRFTHNTERVEHDQQLTAIIETAFSDSNVDAVAELLDEAGIAYARLRTPAQLLEHPQLRGRQRWRSVETPAGVIEALVPPVSVAGREPLMRPVPGLGEHSEAIRREFGARAAPVHGGTRSSVRP